MYSSTDAFRELHHLTRSTAVFLLQQEREGEATYGGSPPHVVLASIGEGERRARNGRRVGIVIIIIETISPTLTDTTLEL